MAGKDQAAQPSRPFRSAIIPAGFTLARGVVLSMRPLQWTKSLLLFLPLAFAVEERWSPGDAGLLGELFLRALAGAAIFCVLSCAVYIINDLFDREKDRAHPRKRNRPIASGELPLVAAQATAVLLLGVSLAASFLMGTSFGIVSVAFLAMNLGYSSLLKRVIILDVMMVAAGYLLRVAAGALVIDVTVSPWLYTTICLGALFIALAKRYSELKAAGASAPSQRAVLERYTQVFLGRLLAMATLATLVAYAVYTFAASNVPANHTMMLTIPFVVFGLLRYLYLVKHTNDAESPEMVIVKDVPLVVDVLLWAVAAISILAVSR